NTATEIANSSVFVVIPAFNEESQIRNTVEPLIEEGYSVVVVDDCSSDNTKEKLQGLPVYYLRHEVNLGQGAALQTGMEFALKHCCEYIVHFDADGQHNYKEIPLLLAALKKEHADVALGTRFKRKEDVFAIPLLRRIILKAAIVVNGLLTGLWLSDAHNGFRMFTREAAQKIRLTENRMAHATEIIWLIKQHNLKVVEVPVHITYTVYSKLKGQKPSNALNILIDLLLNRIF
ncbi:MAG: glycosyltransferase family 2 protein, partial [Chitinophagales bacterium]|nr:glycosyltransferase family 2 protein [Chitinophagales bacterium]